MSRPKPTVLLQHSNKTTFKMDEVLAAEGIWAVFYDGNQPLLLCHRHISYKHLIVSPGPTLTPFVQF